MLHTNILNKISGKETCSNGFQRSTFLDILFFFHLWTLLWLLHFLEHFFFFCFILWCLCFTFSHVLSIFMIFFFRYVFFFCLFVSSFRSLEHPFLGRLKFPLPNPKGDLFFFFFLLFDQRRPQPFFSLDLWGSPVHKKIMTRLQKQISSVSQTGQVFLFPTYKNDATTTVLVAEKVNRSQKKDGQEQEPFLDRGAPGPSFS